MAVKANIIIDQGTDYTTNITLSDVNDTMLDLTGYTATAQIRKTYTSTTATPFTTTVNTATGSVLLSLSSTASANLAAGRYVYDLLLKSSANVKSRVVEGIVTISPRVTK
jgi:hypothetical protein